MNSVWSAVIGLAVVPFYLKFLGIEAYGMIGFFATTQALFQLLDFGLAPTINREISRCSVTGDITPARNLLHSLAVIYWTMTFLIALIIFFIAPFIAQYWLHPKHMPQETVFHAMILMGVVIACRWPAGLYQGALMGAQRLAVSSAINIAMVTLGSVGAVAVLAFVSPTIEAFFIWQAVIGIGYAIVMRWAAWKVLGKPDIFRFDIDELKRIWRFSAGVSGIALSSVVLMQLDKVLLSRILSLEDFGRYTLAGVVAGGLYVLLTPAFSVIYPRMSALVAIDDTESLSELYRSGTRLLLALLFPIAAVGAIFSNDLVFLWTGNVSLASSVTPVISLFLLGTALNGVMHFPYALQLAYGITRLPLLINAVLVVVMVPMTILLALSYGVVGGAASWAILNGIYLLFGTWLTHRFLLKGIGIKWLLWDVTLPLVLSLLIVGVGGGEVNKLALSHFEKLFFGCGLALIAFFAIVLISPKLRLFAKAGFARVAK